MPDVISNTSPLQYLHQAELLYLLPRLAESIFVPPAVIDELKRGRMAGLNLPTPENLSWVKIQTPRTDPRIFLSDNLGVGESEVLALCSETQDHIALLDDRQARVAALRMGFKFTGTLGILLSAKNAGLIPLIAPALDSLDILGFRVSLSTRTLILKRAGEI